MKRLKCKAKTIEHEEPNKEHPIIESCKCNNFKVVKTCADGGEYGFEIKGDLNVDLINCIGYAKDGFGRKIRSVQHLWSYVFPEGTSVTIGVDDNIKRPLRLYAIENIKTKDLIFNARGGTYKDLDAATAKLKELGDGYRIVEYKLQEDKN